MTDNTKYPPSIQKLFTPKLPILYKPPTDYSIDERKTHYIAPLSSVKAQYLQIIDQMHKEDSESTTREVTSLHQQNLKAKKLKTVQQRISYERQLKDWDDPELLAMNEKKNMMKDPYRTVFISRLPYQITELEISKNFQKFGIIESIRIIRCTITNKSKGYGFIVFEREADAKSCIRELAPVGLRVTSEEDNVSRTILVDIERGRLQRTWKPRRLGGGLGSRHYTKPNPLGANNNASAAASGRRLHLSSNPYNSGGSKQYSAQSHPQANSGYRTGQASTSLYPNASSYSSTSSYSSITSNTISSLGSNTTSSLGSNTTSSLGSTYRSSGNDLAADQESKPAYSYTSRSSDLRSADNFREKHTSRSERSIRNIRNN